MTLMTSAGSQHCFLSRCGIVEALPHVKARDDQEYNHRSALSRLIFLPPALQISDQGDQPLAYLCHASRPVSP